MKVDIVQKNYTMSEKLGDIILKKTNKLSKYFDDDATVKVMLKREKDVFKMEITATFNGSYIRAEKSGENMYENIDILLPKIEKQIVKNKGKLSKKLKSNAFKDQNYLYMDDMPVEKPSKIAKFKSFKVYPLSIEDAVDMMNMLDHDFYVFINKENNRLQIVYKRHDDDIGVLEPVE
ncbi:MAG: ribosome-associated translation inhibitor RaiA [Clostridia bacterium]|nr:ribosome-associated translation inhibitor RaiA [Clostridia bacterium]